MKKKNYSDVFRQGGSARALMKPASSNPHPPGSHDHKEWHDGWVDAGDLDCDPNALLEDEEEDLD